jgi:hypothetical protein
MNNTSSEVESKFHYFQMLLMNLYLKKNTLKINKKKKLDKI